MELVPHTPSRTSRSAGMLHLRRLLTVSASAVLLAACSGGGGDQAARSDEGAQQAPAQSAPQATSQQAALPAKLCELFPQADAEKIMGKALVEQRNDNSACHYRDAKGTEGTGVWLDANILTVSDQCRLVPQSELLSGVGSEACIAVGVPVGLYTTVVFNSGGQTFEARAPGQDRASEKATAVARVVLAKRGS
jgi:hypothetical protein